MGSLAVDPAGLGSPFNTPTSKRYLTTAATPASATTPAASATAEYHSPTASTSTSRRLFRPPLGPSARVNTPHHARKTSLSKALALPDLLLQSDDTDTNTETPMDLATFTDLPVELVQHIHSLADNPFLAVTSRYLYNSLTGASPTYVARHMLFQYRYCSYKEILTFALRRPIVTIPVIEEMVRIWDERREFKRRHASRGRPTQVDGVPVTPRATRPALEVTDLPRRLFRHIPRPGQPAINPMIPYLLDKNYDMVEFLLSKGADPKFRGNKAVEAAIQIKDLRMVKILVEPPTLGSTPQNHVSKKKRRRLSDRVEISQPLVALAMKKGTEEIVKYFVEEKGESST